MVYTGTHDNDTTPGWLDTLNENDLAFLRRYTGSSPFADLNWELIRLAFMSVAHTAIIPLQDVLGVGSEGRMNTPGLAGGNWGWRYSSDRLTVETSERLKALTELYDRAGEEKRGA